MITEKSITYFGFPSTNKMLKNVESFASNINQSLANAWIDLIYRFMKHFKSSDNGDQFIPSVILKFIKYK
jgi:hypothetical protein